jgi:opacity protein-like surface antigen
VKKSYLLICAVLLSASVAAATDWPQMETFLGYNFVRFNPNSGYAPSFNANGGSGQFVYNLSPWIGGVFDMGAVTKGTLNQTSVDTTVMDFVAGPRITFHNHSRFLPYVQALFGGAYSTTSTAFSALPGAGAIFPPGIIVNPNEAITARLTASNTGFAMLVGGGLDIKVSKHMAFRPFEASYYLTRIPSLLTGNTSNRNNFRYAAGVNFLFGAR